MDKARGFLMAISRPCKDCRAEGLPLTRPVKFEGPRCATHWRVERKRRTEHAKDLRITANFEITPEEYWALYAAQGGCCFICRMAKGHVRRLAIDHDHRCQAGHPPEKGCRKCIRGLVCKRCNRLVAFLGPEALARAIQLLTDPPARAILAA